MPLLMTYALFLSILKFLSAAHGACFESLQWTLFVKKKKRSEEHMSFPGVCRLRLFYIPLCMATKSRDFYACLKFFSRLKILCSNRAVARTCTFEQSRNENKEIHAIEHKKTPQESYLTHLLAAEYHKHVQNGVICGVH